MLLFFMMSHHNSLVIISMLYETSLPDSRILLIHLGEGDPPLKDAVEIADRVLHRSLSSL